MKKKKATKHSLTKAHQDIVQTKKQRTKQSLKTPEKIKICQNRIKKRAERELFKLMDKES